MDEVTNKGRPEEDVRREGAAQDAPDPLRPVSPLDTLLEELKSALHAKRRDLLARVHEIEASLASYQRAAEERIANEFTREHRLRAPRGLGVSPEVAAERLRRAVLALPELARAATAEAAPRADEAPPEAAPEGPDEPPEERPLPWLDQLSEKRKLVIVGALAGRQKLGAVPSSLENRTEWIDTENDGVHAIGNLPQRIRQGRVAAVIILDRAVQHKHSEPLMAAARSMGVPVGFAGKGGLASIRRALSRIDEQLERG